MMLVFISFKLILENVKLAIFAVTIKFNLIAFLLVISISNSLLEHQHLESEMYDTSFQAKQPILLHLIQIKIVKLSFMISELAWA